MVCATMDCVLEQEEGISGKAESVATCQGNVFSFGKVLLCKMSTLEKTVRQVDRNSVLHFFSETFYLKIIMGSYSLLISSGIAALSDDIDPVPQSEPSGASPALGDHERRCWLLPHLCHYRPLLSHGMGLLTDRRVSGGGRSSHTVLLCVVPFWQLWKPWRPLPLSVPLMQRLREASALELSDRGHWTLQRIKRILLLPVVLCHPAIKVAPSAFPFALSSPQGVRSGPVVRPVNAHLSVVLIPFGILLTSLRSKTNRL